MGHQAYKKKEKHCQTCIFEQLTIKTCIKFVNFSLIRVFRNIFAVILNCPRYILDSAAIFTLGKCQAVAQFLVCHPACWAFSGPVSPCQRHPVSSLIPLVLDQRVFVVCGFYCTSKTLNGRLSWRHHCVSTKDNLPKKMLFKFPQYRINVRY